MRKRKKGATRGSKGKDVAVIKVKTYMNKTSWE